MGYPDTFEGFMIEDQKKWTEFKKKEVNKPKQNSYYNDTSVIANNDHSSSQSHSKTATLTLRSMRAVSAALMYTPSMVDGVIAQCRFVSATRSLARPSR